MSKEKEAKEINEWRDIAKKGREVFNYAKTVISTNVEEEEKLKLFNEKMGELKELFLKSPLDKLRDISFKETQDELPNTSGDGKIKLGDEEGSGSDGQD